MTRPEGIPMATTPTRTDAPAAFFADLAGIDWNDLDAVAAGSTRLLDVLTDDRDTLTGLAHRILDDPALAALCEHYDILDKLVLHDDPTGWRLRLHVFLPGYYDRPHNHRWTYTTRILTGSYTHTLYGTEDQLPRPEATTPQSGPGPTDLPADVALDVSALRARQIRTEPAGATYTLHHTMIHSVTADAYTTSLVVRGPAVKDRFLVTDRVTGRAWWQYGAATETPADAYRKRMTPDQIHARLNALAAADVID